MPDQITLHGHTFRIGIQPDDWQDPPWTQEDGHGPVSDWTTRDKHPGELILEEYRGSYRYYDFQAAVKQSRAEGWNAVPFTGTRGERAARAARADFERLKGWCDGRWCYVSVFVTVLDDYGDTIDEYTASLGGIESDAGEYLDEVARELAEEVIALLGDELAA